MEKKKVIICILLIMALALSVTNVFALDGLGSGNNTSDRPAIDEDDDETDLRNLIGNNNNNNNNNNANRNNVNQNNNSASIKDGNTPNTGIEDIPVIAIGICIVSAVVAYTQIKRYNV